MFQTLDIYENKVMTLRSLIPSAFRDLFFLLAFFCILVALGWVGFIASDDVTYAHGAYGWIEEFPYIGGHGTIRYPITIPMALSFLIFGNNEFALALPSLLYMLGALSIAWNLVKASFGRRAAFLAIAAAITSPLFITQASIANSDMPELFFQLASIALFLKGLEKERPAVCFFFAGTIAGLGFLTRETSIFIALFYAALFLSGYRHTRTQYLWIVAGFVVIWAIEVSYLWSMTGDPFYRINISLNHDSTIDRSVDVAGNLIFYPLIDPVLVILFNQEFMLLYWLAIPAGLWLLNSPKISVAERSMIRLLGLYGSIIFVASGAAVTLLPLNPRYFEIPTLIACLFFGIAVSKCLVYRSWLPLLLVASLTASNALGVLLENRSFVFGPETYARLAREAKEPVRTDPMTRYRADLLIKWNGAAKQALAAPPREGTLYLWNPALAETPNARMDEEIAWRYAKPKGTIVAIYRPRIGALGRVIKTVGFDQFIPISIWKRFKAPHPPVELIRVAKP